MRTTFKTKNLDYILVLFFCTHLITIDFFFLHIFSTELQNLYMTWCWWLLMLRAGLCSHHEPGWLSAEKALRSHKASGPTRTGTKAPPGTHCKSQWLENGTYCMHLRKDTCSMCKHSAHLHAEQSADAGFGGITDGFQVMPPFQSQDHPTPS